MPLPHENWFSEISDLTGSAFAVRLRSTVLHEEQTPYQKIKIFDTEYFGRLMVLDGCMMLTSKDNFLYHEMMSHTVLFTHPKPVDVVIIGGGDCGTLKEVLRHASVQSVVQIDIDARVTALSEIYFPELCESNGDPRVRFMFEDGIAWMQNSKPNSLDVIIVDSTDPIGPGEVLVTKEFFQSCQRALRPNGVMIQQSESPLCHQHLITQMRNRMREAGFTHCQMISFPQPCYPLGWWSATMASCHIPLDLFREDDARHKPFKTQYYNCDIHHAALAVPEFLIPLFC